MSELARRFISRWTGGTPPAALVTLVTIAMLGASSAMAAGAVTGAAVGTVKGAGTATGTGTGTATGTVTGVVTGTVTIKTAFENSPISLDTSDAVGYALTNTTGATQTVTFTDDLPSGVALDNPVGTTNTNGTGACTLTTPTANPGGTSVTVTVAVPAATGTGAVCTISFGIVASTPFGDAAVSDSYADVSTASGVVPAATPGSLIVLTTPALSLTSPTNNQTFSLGQSASAGFACSATDPLDSIDSFFGTDDEGNQIESGAPIDTVDPGTHSLTVECYSAAGGGSVSQSVSYTVGSYTLTGVIAARKTDVVSFRTVVPAGRIVAEVIYGRKVIGMTSTSVTSQGTASVAIKPTNAGRRLLAAIRARSVAVKLQVSFKPQAIGTGDGQITPAAATVVTRNVRLPLNPPGKKARRRPHARGRRRG